MAKAKKVGAREFRPLTVNPNAHTQKGLGMLEDAMHEDGYVAPMNTAANGVVLDGNARLEKVGTVFPDAEPIIVEHDGTRPIFCVRTDIPDEKAAIAQRITLRANRIAQADLSYDADALRRMQADGVDLSRIWEDDKELAKLLGETPSASEPVEDTMVERWAVVVTCRNESDQHAFIERMEKEGRECQALMS